MPEVEWDDEAREDWRVKVPRHLRKKIVEFARDHLDSTMAAETGKAARAAIASRAVAGADADETDCVGDAGGTGPYYWQRCITVEQRAQFNANSSAQSQDTCGQPWDYILTYKRMGWLSKGYKVLGVYHNDEFIAANSLSVFKIEQPALRRLDAEQPAPAATAH